MTWRIRQSGLRRLLAMAYRRAVRPAWFMGLVLSLTGCIMPATAATATPVPTMTPDPDITWEVLADGIEQRTYRPTNSRFARLQAIRIDPAQVTFRVHYRPGEPLFASGWRDELPDAALFINSNFFDRDDNITGFLVADGVRYGEPYRRRGGTFYVDAGVPTIQSNITDPYTDKPHDQAVQAFPMLMTDGAQSYFDTRPDRSTRRTVIALDAQGRVVILVTVFGGMTLLDLAEYLPTTDLQLVDALNLDGGGSTMLDIEAGDVQTSFVSFDPVPAVLAVYPNVP